MNHDCYIQPITEDKKETAGTACMVAAEVEDDSGSETEEETSRPPLAPLLCFADFECTVNENKEFPVNKGCWLYKDEDEIYEAETAKELIEDLDQKTELDGQEQQVFCYFHNMKGFHRMSKQG